METSFSGANHAVMHAQNDWWGLGTIKTRSSGANHSVLHAQNDRWDLGPLETRISDPKGDILHAKTTDEGWDSERLTILWLKSLFWMRKILGEVWDP